MNLLKYGIKKSSNKVLISNRNNELSISNESNKIETIKFEKIIKTDSNFSISSNVVIENGDCTFNVLNVKGEKIFKICPNKKIYYSNALHHIIISCNINAKSRISIKLLCIEPNETDSSLLADNFKNDVLLLSSAYPDFEDKKNFNFLHEKIREFQNNNLNVDVAIINDDHISKSEEYNYDGVNVIATGYTQIRTILQNKSYKKILIAFPNNKFFQILDASDMSKTQLIFYFYGTDILYKNYKEICAPYFKNDFDISENKKQYFNELDSYIKKYNEKNNVMFIFQSEEIKNVAEKNNNINFNNYKIFSNFIDDKKIKYLNTNSELRNKIFMIKSFDNYNSNGVDIDVRTILELSNRKCFKKLSFNIYGCGDKFDELLAPIKEFDNVHIYNQYLDERQIRNVFQNNGIGLFSSRFILPSTIMKEAALSGKIVLLSDNDVNKNFKNINKLLVSETENFVQYADAIEKISDDKGLFIDLSKSIHELAVKEFFDNNQIKSEIKAIKDFNNFEEVKIPSLSKKPLLSIVIPSYNVGKFIRHGVFSLLQSKYIDKLEIIVVNDGSKDNTVDVVKEMLKEYCDCKNPALILVDKPNGGHGSTINKGIEIATGKYFKLMDGDDCFITSEFDKLIEKLEIEDSDIILNDYYNDLVYPGEHPEVNFYNNLKAGIQYKLDDLYNSEYGFGKWGPMLPTSTYKTNMLKNANFKLDEHCFYVDMELNMISYVYAKTITYYPFVIYNYMIGRNGQSISKESYKKNILNHEKVCIRLADEYTKFENILSYNRKEYIMNRIIIPMCSLQYDMTSEMFKNGEKFKSFNSKLKKYPSLYNDKRIIHRRKIKLHQITDGNLVFADSFISGMSSVLRRNK